MLKEARLSPFHYYFVPELRLFKSIGAAMESWEQAKTIRPPRRIAVVCLAIALLGVLAYCLALLYLPPLRWLQESRYVAVGVFVVLLPAAYLAFRLLREPMRRVVRGDLQAAGVPICIQCGYDLRGQTIARCPECGQPFEEKLLPEKTDRLPG